MAARLFRNYSIAPSAMEGTMKTHYFDAKLSIEPPCKIVCLIFAVIIADSGMIAAHDKMGAAIVSSNDGMKNSFSWTGIAHGGGKNSKHHIAAGVKSVNQCLVPGNDCLRRIVAGTFPADKRLNKQAVDMFQCYPLQVFMGAVGHIAGLKPGDGGPAPTLDFLLRFIWREFPFRNIKLDPLVQLYRTADEKFAQSKKICHARVRILRDTKHLSRNIFSVVAVNTFRKDFANLISFKYQGDAWYAAERLGLIRGHIKYNGYWEHIPRGQTHTFNRRVEFIFVHEAGQGRECPEGNFLQFQVLKTMNFQYTHKKGTNTLSDIIGSWGINLRHSGCMRQLHYVGQ